MGLVREVVTLVSILVAIWVYMQFSNNSPELVYKGAAEVKTTHVMDSETTGASTTRLPTYFFSHGGPTVQYETQHPAYAILQSIGKEITHMKPTAVVVFSAHWQAGHNSIQVNSAESTDLIYDFYGFPKHFYQAKYPNRGSPELASKITALLLAAGIKSSAVTRGLDHGVWSGFSVAFDPESNPLGVPLVQVSLYDNEDPDAHYALGEAVSSLRDDGIVIVGAGMSVHNLQAMQQSWGDPRPQPWAVSFDEALRDAVLTPPQYRPDRMREVTMRPDARKAHPTMDHLMPVYVAAGAAAGEQATQIWTLQEGSFAWAQYRFGKVPKQGGEDGA